MNSIWNNLYDKAKDRRYGTLFFFSLFGFFGLFLAGVIIYKILEGIDFSLLDSQNYFDLQNHFLELVPGLVIIMVALAVRGYRRARAQGGHKFRREELSRDEICKARSKLMKRNQI
jgi:hypothetical protein